MKLEHTSYLDPVIARTGRDPENGSGSANAAGGQAKSGVVAL